MSELKKPIRMCIICRDRFEQKNLTRFQINNGKIVEFSKSGRSLYICLECKKLEEMQLVKALNSKLKLKYKKLEEFGKFFSNEVQKHY
jgi:predicted RNA-binding protein YlxR (DUF448 family)